MPQRFLKPGIVQSIRLARCSPWAQLLYYKLISLVDDYSRYDAHPLAVARNAFPYGDNHGRAFSEEKIAAWLAELESARLNEADEPCLTRYTADGKPCLILHRWTERLKFQNGKYPGSRYPSPEKDVQVWLKLSKDVQSRQQLSSPPSSSITTTTTASSPSEKNGDHSGKTQFAALRAQIQRLEKLGADLTKEERLDLRKKKCALDELQKKQAEG